jgi:probable sporulation protein (polysaccharide deacetylase family)
MIKQPICIDKKIIALLGFLFIFAGFFKWISPYLFSEYSANKPQPIFHGNSSIPKVALACNVFWGEEYLPDMLSTLAKNHIKITFFIGGSWGRRFPGLVSEIASQGHELANHSFTHPHPTAISKEKNKAQILQTENLVRELTGVQTKLYAPPYGEYNDTVLAAADELGYKTIMWSIDTIDWKRPPAQIIINRVMKKLHNGAIILIHPTAPTAQALPELINRIQALGYTIGTVSDVLQ